MAEAKIIIGNRNFRVSCEDGQEELLQEAGELLNTHAKSVVRSDMPISESQMLLLVGLLAADQAKAAEKENQNMHAYQRDLESRISKVEDKAITAGEQTRQELTTELHETKVKLGEAQKDLKLAEEQVKKLNSEFEGQKEKLTALQTEFDENKKASVKDQETTKNDKADQNQLKTELDEANLKITGLEKKIVELSENNRVAQTTVAGEEARLISLEQEVHELASENKSLNQKLATLTQGIPIAAFEASEEEPKSTPAKDKTKKTTKSAPNDDLLEELVAGLERIAKS